MNPLGEQEGSEEMALLTPLPPLAGMFIRGPTSTLSSSTVRTIPAVIWPNNHRQSWAPKISEGGPLLENGDMRWEFKGCVGRQQREWKHGASNQFIMR